MLVAATDGVGTKVKIAIETGRHDTIGIDLVAMCVNDLVVQGAEPLFFLDYFACGKLEPEIGAAVVAGIAVGCRQAGCALIGGETAEMPGLYRGDDYDLAGFAVGAAERGALLPRADIAAGDAIIGLASSGVHSNGYSLVRKVVEKSGLPGIAPAPVRRPAHTLGEALLTPTRIYVKSCLAALRETKAVKGLAHHHRRRISGQHSARAAGWPRRAHRPCHACRCCRCSSGWRGDGGIAQSEMLRTFNCGIGMIVIAAAKDAGAVTPALDARRRERLAARQRECAPPASTRVVYDGQLDLDGDA